MRDLRSATEYRQAMCNIRLRIGMKLCGVQRGQLLL